MAKKKDNSPSLRADIANPFQHIRFSQADLGSYDRSGGGGAKELVTVDDAYRKALAQTLVAASQAVDRELKKYPDSLCTLVLKLRDIGIAKSHRPIQLAAEAGLQSVGHGKIDEMLVGASSASINSLHSKILTRDVGKIRANLSAIVSIEPWTRDRRLPVGLSALRENGRALLRLFKYELSSTTSLNYEGAKSVLKKLNVPYREVSQPRGLPLFCIKDMDAIDDEVMDILLDYPGARELYPEPFYRSFSTTATSSGAVSTCLPFSRSATPTVAVFDTGVGPEAAVLAGWIKSRDIYVLPPDTNYEHGTQVASLVIDARHFNNSHPWLPHSQAFVHDVCALEASGAYMSDLEIRLREAVSKRPDIKVWNLSLGGGSCSEQTFSDLAVAMDELSDQHNVLFVVAAGNYNDLPRRSWPSQALLDDRVSSPGDSVRSLTVAAISHADAPGALSAAGEPTPYSRRGPGPVFTPKPDVTHAGGGVHSLWGSGASSLTVVNPNNTLMGGFGTSFAAPIVSSMAANAWQAVDAHPDLTATPALVKALMIHAAQLSSPDYTPDERRYFGAGRPEEIVRLLYDSPDSFTLVFEAQVLPSMRWRKSDYPIPESLITNGKFRGEIIITAAYAPPLDADAGSEYVRANVEVSFGSLEDGTITGRVPMDWEEGQNGYESTQVEHGGKWSPVKVHRKVFPNGIDVKTWALQATVFLRAFEEPLAQTIPVSLVVTLRSLDRNPNVHAEGLRALATKNWVHTTLPVRVPIQN
ncbi:S8 family anti-phage peptidase IteS [Pseudomonas syringae]|uniref:S8 family anti-phage peptidase IteS n=1 Tax=Pseudomonas syringae TaxID=317 RepID=UPI001F3124B3|nr:S8 family anti-phage peptidase IteS [Pseudomonas syringae]